MVYMLNGFKIIKNTMTMIIGYSKYIMKNQCHINDEKFFQNDYINYQYGNIKINVLYNEVQFANNKILLSYLQSKKICNCIENLWNKYRMPTVQQLNKRNIL